MYPTFLTGQTMLTRELYCPVSREKSLNIFRGYTSDLQSQNSLYCFRFRSNILAAVTLGHQPEYSEFKYLARSEARRGEKEGIPCTHVLKLHRM